MLWIHAIFLMAYAADPDGAKQFNWTGQSKGTDHDSSAASDRNQIQSGQGESESPSE
jgi:hypothetical protein